VRGGIAFGEANGEMTDASLGIVSGRSS
jgi:hypothetical protein